MYSFPTPHEITTGGVSVVGVGPAHPPKVPATFADLVAEVESCDDPPRQKQIATALIRNCAWFIETARARARGRVDRIRREDVSLAALPCDVAWINANMGDLPAAVFNMTPRSYENAWSGLRRELRQRGLIEPRHPPALRPDGPWAELLKKLAADQYTHLGLGRFAAWCESRDIAPETVTPATFEAFRLFIRTRLLIGDGDAMTKTAAKAWRKAAAMIAAWPQIELRIAARRKPYTLPFSAFPEPFQIDVEVFRQRLAGVAQHGPFRSSGLRRSLRPSTIDSRLFSIRQAASALVLLGRDPATILSLTDLVEERAFADILTFFWQRAIDARTARGEGHAHGEGGADGEPRAEDGVTAQTGGIATTLMIVARHHCKCDPETLKRLAGMARDVTPDRQSGLSQKNRDRLRQFDDPHILLKLLHLPARLMRRAEKMENPLKAARLARVAAALEFELHIPLRVKNLAELRLGVDLKLSGGRRNRITHLVLTRAQTKNTHDVEWAIDPQLSDFLMRYVERFRSALAAPGSDDLFPAAATKTGPITEERMGETIKDIIAAEVGIVTNVHLFRSLAARLLLDHSPGSLEDVRLLLGDKSMQTVLAHYAAREPAAAARRHADVLRKARSGTPAAPTAARGRKPRS